MRVRMRERDEADGQKKKQLTLPHHQPLPLGLCRRRRRPVCHHMRDILRATGAEARRRRGHRLERHPLHPLDRRLWRFWRGMYRALSGGPAHVDLFCRLLYPPPRAAQGPEREGEKGAAVLTGWQMYIHEDARGNQDVRRMKSAVWVDLTNALLWLASTLGVFGYWWTHRDGLSQFTGRARV